MSLLADESITLKPTVTLELQPDSYATVALYCSLHTYTAEYQIGLGYISHNCLYDTTNYFAIKIPKATFAIGDYILRIDNIKEAGVSIPTFDKRIESSLEYLEGGVVKMKDVIYVTPPASKINKIKV